MHSKNKSMNQNQIPEFSMIKGKKNLYCTFFLTTLFFGLLDGLNVDGVELDTRTV